MQLGKEEEAAVAAAPHVVVADAEGAVAEAAVAEDKLLCTIVL